MLFYGAELEITSVCINFHVVFSLIKSLRFLLGNRNNKVLLNNRNRHPKVFIRL